MRSAVLAMLLAILLVIVGCGGTTDTTVTVGMADVGTKQGEMFRLCFAIDTLALVHITGDDTVYVLLTEDLTDVQIPLGNPNVTLLTPEDGITIDPNVYTYLYLKLDTPAVEVADSLGGVVLDSIPVAQDPSLTLWLTIEGGLEIQEGVKTEIVIDINSEMWFDFANRQMTGDFGGSMELNLGTCCD